MPVTITITNINTFDDLRKKGYFFRLELKEIDTLRAVCVRALVRKGNTTVSCF